MSPIFVGMLLLGTAVGMSEEGLLEGVLVSPIFDGETVGPGVGISLGYADDGILLVGTELEGLLLVGILDVGAEDDGIDVGSTVCPTTVGFDDGETVGWWVGVRELGQRVGVKELGEHEGLLVGSFDGFFGAPNTGTKINDILKTTPNNKYRFI